MATPCEGKVKSYDYRRDEGVLGEVVKIKGGEVVQHGKVVPFRYRDGRSFEVHTNETLPQFVDCQPEHFRQPVSGDHLMFTMYDGGSKMLWGYADDYRTCEQEICDKKPTRKPTEILVAESTGKLGDPVKYYH